MSKCPKCGGNQLVPDLEYGGDADVAMITCSDCNGTGQKKETCTCDEYNQSFDIRKHFPSAEKEKDPNCPVHKETPNDLRERIYKSLYPDPLETDSIANRNWRTMKVNDLEKIAREYADKRVREVKAEIVHTLMFDEEFRNE